MTGEPTEQEELSRSVRPCLTEMSFLNLRYSLPEVPKIPECQESAKIGTSRVEPYQFMRLQRLLEWAGLYMAQYVSGSPVVSILIRFLRCS